MKQRTDYSLYLVTDRHLAGSRAVEDIVRLAVSGGVTCVQLRDKTASTRELLEAARRLLAVLRPCGVPLIVNDRVDVALAAGADGIHVGQSDMPLATAQSLVPAHYIIGVSASSVEEAILAQQAGAAYIGISPVFSTPTKTDTAPALGLAGISAIRAATTLPLVGIGGIHLGNAADIIHAGADGIAVVSAIMAAENPQQAAADLKHAVTEAKRKHT